MARYHFRLQTNLSSQGRLVPVNPRTIVTANLDNYEEIQERAELLAHLLLMTKSDWDEDDPREILVTDDDGHEVLSLALSEISKKLSDD
jgi:hypothetical protein